MIKKNIQLVSIVLIITSLIAIICFILFPVVVDDCTSACPSDGHIEICTLGDCVKKMGISPLIWLPATVGAIALIIIISNINSPKKKL